MATGNTCHFDSYVTMTTCQDKKVLSIQCIVTINRTWVQLVECCEGVPYYEYRPDLDVNVSKTAKHNYSQAVFEHAQKS